MRKRFPRIISGLPLLFLAACAQPHSFRVMPAAPNYLLRSPDSKDTPFPEVLSHFTTVGRGWVDLRPQMVLRIETAYYQDGAARRGLAGYLGTEVAHFRALPKAGLQLGEVQPLPQRPPNQAPVRQLVPDKQTRYRYHRFFNAVTFRGGDTRGSVLLGAKSKQELQGLGTRLLADPDAVCTPGAAHCTVFPAATSVSMEMEIVVNGTPRTILWGSLLSGLAPRPKHVELRRLYGRRLTQVELDPADPDALRLPLLPGDKITWD
jgi:hypothetical protein